MPRFVTSDEFAALDQQQDIGVRTQGAVADLANSSGRLISYVLSDTSVGRDNHVVAADAWQLESFLRNPVMPWAHDTSQPTIAKWVDIASRGNRLVGTAEYADHDTYPFADTIFRLVKGGFLNAVSTSWIPLEWKFTADRARPGGVDFFKVDLLECSQVPVPALPTALVTARAQGIDTAPLVAWAERMLDGHNFAILPRAELEQLHREAQMPKQKRAKVPAAPPSEADPEPGVEVVPAPATNSIALSKRSLWHVGWLAMMLDDLGYLQDATEYEAAIEEDGSQVPAQLLAALKSLGDVLIAMTIEEVSELLAGDDEDDGVDIVEMGAGAGVKRTAFRLMRRLDAGALMAISGAMRQHIQGRKVTFQIGDLVTKVTRAGRVLSADNETCLRQAHDHINQAADLVRGIVDQVSDDDDDEDDDPDDDDTARGLRQRRAAALKLRLTATA